MKNENTQIEDDGIKKSGGFYISNNYIVDKWARVIGPTSFLVYHTLKRFCNGQKRVVFPNVSISDWSEYIGISRTSFIESIKEMEVSGLISIYKPNFNEKSFGQTCVYTIKDIETIDILSSIEKINKYRNNPEIKRPKKQIDIKKLPKCNKFNDPIFDNSDHMFKCKDKREKRPISTKDLNLTKSKIQTKTKSKIQTKTKSKIQTTIENNIYNTDYVKESLSKDKLNHNLSNNDNLDNTKNTKLSFKCFSNEKHRRDSYESLNCVSNKDDLNNIKQDNIPQESNDTSSKNEIITYPQKRDKLQALSASLNSPKENLKRAATPPRRRRDYQCAQIIQIWNDCPTTSSHTNTNTKKYANIERYLKQLMQGTFSEHNILSDEFIKKNHLQHENLTRQYSLQDLKDIVQEMTKYSMNGYPPQGDKSKYKDLENMLYNRYSNTSMFFICEQSPPKPISECEKSFNLSTEDLQIQTIFKNWTYHMENIKSRDFGAVIKCIKQILEHYPKLPRTRGLQINAGYANLFCEKYVEFLSDRWPNVDMTNVGPKSLPFKKFMEYLAEDD